MRARSVRRGSVLHEIALLPELCLGHLPMGQVQHRQPSLFHRLLPPDDRLRELRHQCMQRRNVVPMTRSYVMETTLQRFR
jgi:hypothetical protein